MASPDLQSEEHRHLLDSIDKLRSQGSSRYVDLPEIIVCGDQSAGKSSVLEAISGMSFPTKDNLCTRFPTELVLRRDKEVASKVSIHPGPERSAEESERLRSFHAMMDPNDGQVLGDVIEKAKAAMNISDGKEFSTNTLRVELSGPDQPHLTMVDLPGLFRAGNRDQSVEDARTIRQMVKSYIKRPRSIILAVVSAKSDAALQEVTELARKLDPTGGRTLGIITKPDCLDTGSDMESSYLRLARNQDVVFRLGWHVLKNRSYDMKNASLEQRNEAEKAFLSQGTWASLDRNCVGADSLKTRLSKVLVNQILHQLPSLLQDVQAGVSECQQRLQQLGAPRATAIEQRRYLLQMSHEFTRLFTASLDGVYNDAFFRSAKTEEDFNKHLRAIIQNTLSDFEEDMRRRGQARVIMESLAEGERCPAGQVSRSQYLDEVKDLMRRTKGRELPGTFNPLIIGKLFLEQCQPWRDIVTSLIENILRSVASTAQAILYHIAISEVADGVWVIMNGGIEDLKAVCNHKVVELINPHYDGHPITYNHYLTDQVQKAQSDRRRQTYVTKIKQVYGGGCFDGGSSRNIAAGRFAELLDVLVEGNETDMERHAASLAADYAQAYYKVARKTFIDNIAVLAIEQCLVTKLTSLFSPGVVFELGDEEICRLTAESESTSAERFHYAEKLRVLESGLLDLKRLEKHRVIFTPDTSDQGIETDQVESFEGDPENHPEEADGGASAQSWGSPSAVHSPPMSPSPISEAPFEA